MKSRIGTALLVLLTLPVLAPAAPVLFENVRIFDGRDPALRTGHVLVDEGRIVRISETPIDPPRLTRRIDGRGRVLTPGLIDLHAHLTIQLPRDQWRSHPTVAGAVMADAALTYLRHGFTTVRDAGSTHPDVARAIESGLFPGPRVFPSGAVITQTSGHGDFRMPHDPHPGIAGHGTRDLLTGTSVIADGVTQTLVAVRENLRAGATQIKIMGGGGVASDYDPIHTLQPSPEEIRAAVQAASDWGTYVLAHSYTAPAIRRLVENGVKVIEHGLLIDEETAQLVAERDVVISTQVLIFRMADDVPGMTEENRRKMRQVLAGQDELMRLIKKYGIKTGFGTDLVFGTYPLMAKELTARTEYFTTAEVLRQATSESAEVIRLCGPLNRHGDFGEVREGWLADLVLFEEDPFEDISVVERPEESVALVMKQGEVVVEGGAVVSR